MEKKNNLLIIGGIILLIIIVAVLAATMSKPQTEPADLGSSDLPSINSDIEVVENENEEENLNQEVVDTRDYTEADLEGIQLMTAVEKQALNIDTDLPIQVLDRDENGTPVFFRFIETKADITVIE